MEVKRILELRDSKGVLFLDSETVEEEMKEAIFYLDKKTEHLSDEEFIFWVLDKAANGSFGYEDQITLKQDVYTPEFAFMSKNILKLGVCISLIIDNLVEANDLLGKLKKSSSEKNMETLNIKEALYIKLGTGGKWANDCFEKGIIRIGWSYIHGVDEINRGEWDDIKARIKQSFDNENKKNGATQDYNALRRICEATQDEVFITFHNNRMYWCQAANGPIDEDSESKFRRCINGWSSEPIGGGEPFNISDISGYLTKTQGFQGTSCLLDDDQIKILRRLINNKKKDSTKNVESLKIKIIETVVLLLKDLHWKDCEILADLIFQRSGWQRISMHGENMKSIDMQYIEPITGNRYDVQVKSGADKKIFHKYVSELKSHETCKFYFITFNPDKSLMEVVSDNPTIEILYGTKLAKLIFDLGLLDWVLRKSY